MRYFKKVISDLKQIPNDVKKAVRMVPNGVVVTTACNIVRFNPYRSK